MSARGTSNGTGSKNSDPTNWTITRRADGATRPWKRAKSLSVVTSSQPCPIASAARYGLHGIGGYERLLEILFDPAHEELDELRTWVGRDFQPERFHLRVVNDRLARMR